MTAGTEQKQLDAAATPAWYGYRPMGLALVGYLVIRGTVMFNGYLYADDFALRFWAHESGLTPEYLFRSYYGHVQPWGLLAQWILQAGWPGSWTALMVWSVGMQLATLVVLWRIVLRLTGSQVAAFLAFLVPASIVVHVRGRRVVVHDHRERPVRAVHDGVASGRWSGRWRAGRGAGGCGPGLAFAGCRAVHQQGDDVPARAGG